MNWKCMLGIHSWNHGTCTRCAKTDGNRDIRVDSQTGPAGAPQTTEDPLVRELDEAVSTIRRTVASGTNYSRSPLRRSAILVMEFAEGNESNYRLHVKLLAELVAKRLLKNYSIWRVDMSRNPMLCGVIAVSGPVADMTAYSKTAYYHSDAEAFVATACQNNWSSITATLSISDAPDSRNAMDLVAIAERFTSIRASLVSHGAKVDKIG